MVEQVGHPALLAVVAGQVLGQIYEELPTDDLVTVHVSHILHHRL